MRLKIFMLLLLAIIPFVYAQHDIEIQANGFFSDSGFPITISVDSSFSEKEYVRLDNKMLVVKNNEKSLELNMDSIKQSIEYIRDMPQDYVFSEIKVSSKELPEIRFKADDKDILVIRQLGDETTKIYYGMPDISGSSEPFAYIVEHFDPDKETSDASRVQGVSRFTVLTRNNPKIEIDNSGLNIINTDGLKINTKSFLVAETLENREIDSIGENRIIEIFGYMKSLVIRLSDKFYLDEKYDRGFKITGETIEPMISFDTEQQFVDISNEQCVKFGFISNPEKEYDAFNETIGFTNNNGWVLGIADLRNENASGLNEMTDFVKKAAESGLTPVIRIINIQDVSAEDTASFIKNLRNMSEDNAVFFQIGDKPNVALSDNELFLNARAYAEYVIDVNDILDDDDIMLISASIDLGKSDITGNIKKKNSGNYMEELLAVDDFWDAIDYYGSPASVSVEDKDYCIIGLYVDFYEGEQLCMDSVYGYRWAIEKIKEKTGKQFSVFLTDSGYALESTNMVNNRELLESLKEDPNVMAALLPDSWIETNTLPELGIRLSEKVCGSR